MTVTHPPPRRTSRRFGVPIPGRAPIPSSRGRRWIYATAVLVLGGYFLFAHGCHGDEDNELFAAHVAFSRAPHRNPDHGAAPQVTAKLRLHHGRGIAMGSAWGNMGIGSSLNWASRCCAAFNCGSSGAS